MLQPDSATVMFFAGYESLDYPGRRKKRALNASQVKLMLGGR